MTNTDTMRMAESANWKVTNPLREMTSVKEEGSFPFNTASGLNFDRYRAG